VRRVEPTKKGARVVAVEFVGEHPPRGYLDKPWAVFQTKTWAGKDRRRKPRRNCSEVVWLEYFSESMQCIRQEAGRAENISQGGVRIAVKAAPTEFELVRVTYPDRGTEAVASVRSRYHGKDGFERLCLKFIDATEMAGRANTQSDEIVKPEKPRAEAETIEQAPKTAPAVKTEPPAEAFKFETQRDEKPSERKSASNKAAEEKSKNKLGRILVADDDPPLRKVLSKILTSAGYDVIVVEDGKAAVEKAKSERPDLVITDGLMPKMHGFLVCKTIKAMPSPPKVIMLTAVYTKMQYKWEAKEKYGADELLTKPFEVAELLACIERQLSSSPRAEAIPA
jgi:twitching motility two-component system response regulator PilH